MDLVPSGLEVVPCGPGTYLRPWVVRIYPQRWPGFFGTMETADQVGAEVAG